MQGHIQRLVIQAFQNQPGKLARASDIGAFADVHKQAVGGDVEGFQAAEPAFDLDLGNFPGRVFADGLGNGADVLWG